jgi:hypothetical protein
MYVTINDVFSEREVVIVYDDGAIFLLPAGPFLSAIWSWGTLPLKVIIV